MNTLSKSLVLVGVTSIGIASSAPALAAEDGFGVSMAADLPTIETSFDSWDICQQVDDMIDKLGLAAGLLPRLCDYEMTQSFGVGVASVSISGTLDELVVHDGYVLVEGGAAISVEMTPLAIEGGRAPTFAPCDEAAYFGCIETPSGDALEDFFATYVPAIDLEVPPPVRVCMPGAAIKVEDGYYIKGRWIPGYWQGWTWVKPRWIKPRWVPPVFETCTVTDLGELPQVTPPVLREVTIDAYPHIVADMGLTVSGDGAIDIEIPIPYAGAKAGYANSWIDLTVSGGVALVLSLDVEDAGADAYLSFDQRVHVRSHYTEATGWTQTATILDNEMAPALVAHDSNLTVRAGVKLGLGATAKASLGSGSDSDDDSETTETTETTTTDGDTTDGDTTDGDTTDGDTTDGDTTDGDTTDAADSDTSDDADDGGDVALPPLPVEEEVVCAAEWLLNGAGLELGFDTKAELVLFVEGSYPLTGDPDPSLVIEAGAEFSHAEALSIPGLCEIGCETVAGDDSAACGTIELFRAPLATL